ncbi:MAG TPA: membrane-bound lytic murein transglycosylase MltF [Gammaproteobacteria bacterium]
MTCSSPPSLLEQIRKTGELRVVTRNNPTTFYYGADEPRGIEYELARGFAERLGVQLKIQVVDELGDVAPLVATRRAHIAAAGLPVSGVRVERVAFGPSYQNVVQQVVYRRGAKRPRSTADLVGKRLEVVADSAQAALLERLRAEEPLLAWVESPGASAETLIRRVANGEIDYTIVTSNVFALLRHSYPDAVVAFTFDEQSGIAWAIPEEGGELEERVAAYFAELRATGELEGLLERYYFPAREFDYVGSRAFVHHFNTRLPAYLEHFREAEALTGLDWRLLAAIAYQESHWNPDAVSATGVRGMMMLTSLTADMMDVSDRHDARDSIIGGARYFQRVLRSVPARIPEPDRTWLAVAAYNIGYGHLEDARVITQMQGADPDKWEDVRERLPLLADEQWHRRVKRGYARGGQARAYVDNVRRYYELLLWMAGSERFELPPAATMPVNATVERTPAPARSG